MFRSRQSLDDKSSPPSLATYHGHADHLEMQRSRTRGSSGGAETPRRDRRQGRTISPVRPRFGSQRNSISSTPKARKTKNARVSLSPGKDGLYVLHCIQDGWSSLELNNGITNRL